MKRLLTSLCFAALFAIPAQASDPSTCSSVRMAEPGWNDLAFTTGVAMVLLDGLGYKPTSSNLSIEVIYQSLKRKDLDIFLGYWDPAMAVYFKPYKDEGSVDTVATNLTGAKYTFAVPTYVWDAGVKDFKDISRFADQFDKKMYGIEAGSNQLMLDAIKEPDLHLDGWDVVESSEVGMLTQVEQSIRNKKFVLFQGWAPHPMNINYDMKYLTGGDKFYGPNLGASTVSTQVRKGYMAECANVAKLLNNLKFDIEFENQGMKFLMTDKMKQEDAALEMIKKEPQRLDAWLKDVETVDGKPGAAAVKAKLGL